MKEEADVLLVGGDIAETKDELKYGLEKLSRFSGVKLAYLGNHELRCMNSPLGFHYLEMSYLFSEYGFNLLDDEPFTYKGKGFIGNSGWFDSGFYKGDGLDGESEKVLDYQLVKHGFRGRPSEMVDACVVRLEDHFNQIEPYCDEIFLGIHHVSFSEFLIYCHSPTYDFKNLMMGSDKFQKFYKHPKVKMGFCGHTHRSGKLNFEDFSVYNLSTDEKQPFLRLKLTPQESK